MIGINQQMRLPDGRVLGYDEYGAPDGAPLIYCHGCPSSRLEWRLFADDALARALGIRAIVPDRPGMGLSDFLEGRTVLAWADDVRALADHLGLGRFAVLGYSAGAPYAAACALALSDRLTRVGFASGLAPFDAPGLIDEIAPANRRFWEQVTDRPRSARTMLRLMRVMATLAGGAMVRGVAAGLPEPDRAAIQADPSLQRAFLAMLRACLRPGVRGAFLDALLVASPWGFDLRDIGVPALLWHGEADENAPVAMARYMAGAMPRSTLELFPGQGHVSLLASRGADLLRALVHDGTPEGVADA